MSGALTLRVITPDRIVLDEQVDSVQVPATDGLMGILPMHAHMVAALDVGLLRFETGSKVSSIFISGGFVEVRDNTVRIVSEAGERPEKIDPERARAAEARARKRIEEGRAAGSEIDLARVEAALKRALTRLRATGDRS